MTLTDPSLSPRPSPLDPPGPGPAPRAGGAAAGGGAVADDDGRRLDWLEAQGWIQLYGVPIGMGPVPDPSRYSCSVGNPGPVRGSAPTLRAAIDAAMAAHARAMAPAGREGPGTAG